MNARRSGFSMVEVLVAMVLLAIILTSLAGFTFSTAQRAMVAGDAGSREAAKLAAVNRYTAVPWDTILAMTASSMRCDTVVYNARNRYRRCARAAMTGSNAEIWVRVQPLQRGLVADSTRFLRPRPPTNPFCTSGNCAP